MKLIHIPTNHIVQIWDMVEPHLKRAEAFGGNEYSVEQIKVYLTLGQWILVVAMDEGRQIHGAATLSFINYPNDRVAFITAMGGKLITGKDTFPQLCRVLGLQGATKIQGAVRPSMAKLCTKYGFSEVAALVEVKL